MMPDARDCYIVILGHFNESTILSRLKTYSYRFALIDQSTNAEQGYLSMCPQIIESMFA